MINIWYDESVQNGITRGPKKVIENLHRSLQDCKIDYSINEEKYKNNLILHWNEEYYFKLKNKQSILIGPHVWVFDENSLINLQEYKSLVFPSKWCVESCLKFYPKYKCNFWPVAIYKPNINNNITTDCLVYYKNRSEKDLSLVLQNLENRNISYVGLQYGNYTQKDFIECLSQVKYCIIIDNTESQGIAIQEMMSVNKPLFVWNKNIWDYLGDRYIVEATTIPYWSDECGEYIDKYDQFDEKFELFLKNLNQYNPQKFIERELSAQKSIEILLNLF